MTRAPSFGEHPHRRARPRPTESARTESALPPCIRVLEDPYEG
ncbi:hypothetical protein [Streptomyces virginiae]|nr:hypothetical protein [Streptomyces virginiae]